MKLLLCSVAILSLEIGDISASFKNSFPKAKFICTYKLTYQPDSTIKYFAEENMKLFISDTISKFISVNKIKKDSIVSGIKAAAKNVSGDNPAGFAMLGSALQAPKTKFPAIIYKYPTKSRCAVYDDIETKHFYYLENQFPCKWVLDQATSNIAGYQCQKATTSFSGRKYEAWFTREIPFSDGPYKFSGLPGLIVMIYDTKKSYKFELLGISKASENFFISPPDFESALVSKKDFQVGADASRAEAINRAQQMGFSFTNPEEVKKQYQEKLKRDNNPIELK